MKEKTRLREDDIDNEIFRLGCDLRTEGLPS